MEDYHLQADEIAFVGDADTDWQADKKNKNPVHMAAYLR